jgi:hypothetical protein
VSDALQRLESLLRPAAAGLEQLELEQKLQWLEDAAEALEALDLGEAGRTGALHLRAALGAFVQWAEDPQRESERALADLELLTRALVNKGLTGMYRGLAQAYGELGLEDVGQAFLDAAGAVERGQPIPPSVTERLEKARSLEPT